MFRVWSGSIFCLMRRWVHSLYCWHTWQRGGALLRVCTETWLVNIYKLYLKYAWKSWLIIVVIKTIVSSIYSHKLFLSIISIKCSENKTKQDIPLDQTEKKKYLKVLEENPSYLIFLCVCACLALFGFCLNCIKLLKQNNLLAQFYLQGRFSCPLYYCYISRQCFFTYEQMFEILQEIFIRLWKWTWHGYRSPRWSGWTQAFLEVSDQG